MGWPLGTSSGPDMASSNRWRMPLEDLTLAQHWAIWLQGVMTKFAMLAAVETVPIVRRPSKARNRPTSMTMGKMRLLMREVLTTIALRLC